jgi:hypothetical protein
MNGGRSPNDSSVVNRICFTVLLLFTVVAWFTNEICDLAITVTVDVSKEYIMKYSNYNFFLSSSAVSIHPVWLIDGYVRIFRNDVWFIPPKAPTVTDIRIVSIKYETSIMGAVSVSESQSQSVFDSRSGHCIIFFQFS